MPSARSHRRLRSAAVRVFYPIVFALSLVLLAGQTFVTARGEQPISDAATIETAQGLLGRLLPDHVDHLVFEVIPPAENGNDVFEVESRDGKIVVRGNNAVAMASGLNHYLKHQCLCDVSWGGTQLNVPSPLPVLDAKVRRVSPYRYRYFLNYCCFGYTLPWYDWPQWERLIDWMALNGINMPLSVTGQEGVWREVFHRLDLSDEQLSQFLAGPPYLPFSWMGCLDSWGGPLPADWIDRRVELERKILARQRAFGMTPVLQGFTGHLPEAVVKKYPDATVQKIRWIEWETYLLDPIDPLFEKLSDIYMEEQNRLFGTDHYYAADTFIEMTPPSGDPEYLAKLSRSILAGLTRTDPRAVWVLQAWPFSFGKDYWTPERLQALLNAVPDDRMILLDLHCDAIEVWRQRENFYGKPWVWCIIQSFGGRTDLHGRLSLIAGRIATALEDPDRGRLCGAGFVNEANGNSPVVYELLTNIFWENEPIDVPSWLDAYADARYGAVDASARRAWRDFHASCYNDAGPFWRQTAVLQVPHLGNSPGAPYNPVTLARGWRELLDASEKFHAVDTYQYDVVNVGAQVLGNLASNYHADMVAAYKAKDAERFAEAKKQFLEVFADMDQLLACREEFLLGRWIADARRWGSTEAEQDRMEWNARRVLTLWGSGRNIRDYAGRTWSGLVGGFYAPRWKIYLDEIEASLRDGREPDAALGEKILAWEQAWTERHDPYPAEPTGDAAAIALRLWEKYGDRFRPDSPSLTTGKPTTCSDALPTHPAELANDGFRRSTDAYWAVDVAKDPAAWWQVDLEEPTDVGRVVVVGYFGDRRWYGFTVEGSLDGKTWTMLVDRRDNRELSTADGYECRFPQQKVRYLRVTMTANSANTGRHLVEVMAYAE